MNDSFFSGCARRRRHGLRIAKPQLTRESPRNLSRFPASGPHPLRTTTLAYAASTAATGNPALVLAGLITSVAFGWQRDATGGVLAPAVTHVTWSVLMLRYLPPLFRDADRVPLSRDADQAPGAG